MSESSTHCELCGAYTNQTYCELCEPKRQALIREAKVEVLGALEGDIREQIRGCQRLLADPVAVEGILLDKGVLKGLEISLVYLSDLRVSLTTPEPAIPVAAPEPESEPQFERIEGHDVREGDWVVVNGKRWPVIAPRGAGRHVECRDGNSKQRYVLPVAVNLGAHFERLIPPSPKPAREPMEFVMEITYRQGQPFFPANSLPDGASGKTFHCIEIDPAAPRADGEAE